VSVFCPYDERDTPRWTARREERLASDREGRSAASASERQTGYMTAPRTPSSLSWVSFTAWLLVGAGYGVSCIGIASIGLFVLPLPVLATLLLVRRRRATRGLPGLISGLAVPVLYVAYLNRAGPGTICTTVTGGQECNGEWSPWPWLAVGVMLFVLGVAVFIDRQRRASHRS
jgi:hypothetical protein